MLCGLDRLHTYMLGVDTTAQIGQNCTRHTPVKQEEASETFSSPEGEERCGCAVCLGEMPDPLLRENREDGRWQRGGRGDWEESESGKAEVWVGRI